MLSVTGLVFAEPVNSWHSATDGRFIVETAHEADRWQHPHIFRILQQAAGELSRMEGFSLPEVVTLRIHPELNSFTTETQVPWYVMAVADRETAYIHSQRLRILLERSSLETTLRHELFHLAQPQGMRRWLAEGLAMRFAGEQPKATPLEGLSEDELDALLLTAETPYILNRAMATAYNWSFGR